MVKSISFFVFLFLFSIKNIYSSHAMGGEITYRCISNNQYELTFSFYRDCSGITAPVVMPITISNSCGFTVPGINLYPLPSSPSFISNVCPTALTTCNGGIYTGIEQWVYTGIITLPGACSDWTFSHTENARNSALTTITGGGSDDLYIYSRINNTNGICNNSPTFSNLPVFNNCVGQQFCFSQGAFDVDGDSLTFEMITPLRGPNGLTVTYRTGYTFSQPVISSPPVSFNSLTGEICMHPTQSDVSPVAVLVKEYRNGVLIGEEERDIQLNIISCANNAPAISGFNGTASYDSTICHGLEFCFNVYSSDADIINNTNIIYDSSLPGAICINTSGYRDTATICWTPSITDTAANPHCFTLTVFDDNCPYFGIQNFTYCLNVKNTTAICDPLFVNQPDFNSLKIFPQPASEILTINFGKDFNSKENYQIKINDLLGKIWYQSSIKETVLRLDLTHMTSSGINFITIFDKNGRVCERRKIIVIPR